MRWSKLQTIAAAISLLGTPTVWSAAVVQEQSTSHPGQPVPALSPAPSIKPSQPDFFVLIDPSHGGDDKGVVFTSKVTEKDVTLAFARALRKELEERGIAARLLREGDTTVTLERRAEVSNQQRPALYVALHAGVPGRGIRVYSALLPPSQPATGNFIPWESAQAASLERSSFVSRVVAQELKKKDFKAWNLQGFLRPLNNIVAPAIGVEIAIERNDVRSLDNLRTQNAMVAALASGIAQSRAYLGAHR